MATNFKGKKKAPQAGLPDFIFNLCEEQNAIAPLRFSVKVKAKAKPIVLMQGHFDFNCAVNLWVKEVRHKGLGCFLVYFLY